MVVGSVAPYFDRISYAFLPWPCLFYCQSLYKACQCGWEGHRVIPALQFECSFKVKPHQPITDAALEYMGCLGNVRNIGNDSICGVYDASSVAQFHGARISDGVWQCL